MRHSWGRSRETVTAGTRADGHRRKAIFVRHRCSVEPLALTSCMQLCSLLDYACGRALKNHELPVKSQRERQKEREKRAKAMPSKEVKKTFRELEQCLLSLQWWQYISGAIFPSPCVALYIFSPLVVDTGADPPMNELFSKHCRCPSPP